MDCYTDKKNYTFLLHNTTYFTTAGYLSYVYTLRLIEADFVSWCMLYTHQGNQMHS